ncbi:MAG TPA: hypothetical protein VI451_08850 [Anaerolineales bacterium]|nr:hypothetical protein [Anaerolineales bacterium]
MSIFTSITEKLRPYLSEGAKIIIIFFLVASAAIFILHSGLSIAHPYPLDYGEAPLVDQAMRMAKGENIYRASLDTPPYTIANYPPLYIVSLIPFLNWFDSPFHMARVVSVTATVLSALFIGLTIHTFSKKPEDAPADQERMTDVRKVVHTLGKNYLPAIVAALFFLASPYIVQWSGLARIDSLALMFATAALYVFARWPKSRWAWIGGGILLVAAAYTRQSYALAAPLAGFVWLFTQDKRRAIGLALLVGGLGLGLFVLLNALTGGGFYYNIVTANVNEFGWERLTDQLSRLWNDSWIILPLGALFLLVGWRSQRSWPLLGLFLVGAFLSGLTIGKIGSNVNYFLELAAALGLVAGILLIWSQAHPWRYVAVILLLTFQFGLLLESSMRNNVDYILSPHLADFTALQRLEQEVKATDGPILADEYMGLLTMYDRALYLQPFEMTQLANEGMWDEQPLLNEISNQNFAAILIHHFGTFQVYRQRWSPGMLAQIDANYRPVKTLAGTVVYIPRGDTGIAPVPAPDQPPSGGSQPVSAGSPIPIGASSFVAEPSIALNPTHPNHLAVVATRVSKQDCELPNCKVEMPFFASEDGGATWQSPATFSYPQQIMYNGQVVFGPDGTLYILAKRNNVITLNQTEIADAPSQADFEDASSAGVNARPWLWVHPETGEIFLTFDAQESDLLFVTPSLKRSNDGVRWSLTARADQHVSASDIFSPRATGPDDIQVLFGGGNLVSLVWVWDPDPWRWPRTVWMANSADGGNTFGEPTPIVKTWGPVNTASANGQFAIVYRTGTEESQQLALATTSDNGQTWTSVIASGDIPLYFDVGKAPGLGIAPNGTIDLVFYAHASSTLDCVETVESWQQTLPFGGLDDCEYNVFYTFSKDGGLSFAEPVQLNQDPIRGEDFIKWFGGSMAGSHLAVASGDDYAYPVWIGTPQSGQTQVFTARIER